MRGPIKLEPMPDRRFMRRIYATEPLPRYQRTPETLAFHEASHATLMNVIGVPYTAVEVRPDGGQVVIDMAAVRASPKVVLDQEVVGWAACRLAAMYAAGIQGELLFLGLPLGGVIFPNDSDHQAARQLLIEQFGSIAPLGFCQRMARAALTERWPEVEELASRLLKEGRIEYRTGGAPQ